VIYGYARVSRQDSNLTLQLDALAQHGAEEIFQEKASGAGICREQLEAVLGRLRPGDTLVVWKLDRLSRTMKQLLELMEDFGRRRIDFVSLTESFDTTTAALVAARVRGRVGGRPQKSQAAVDMAIRMYESGNFTVEDIMRTAGIGRATLYKYLRERKQVLDGAQTPLDYGD